MQFLYQIAIYLYGLFMHLASLFHHKAAKWLAGRKNWQEKLTELNTSENRWIWVHCASLGEFEQGRNIIETIKEIEPDTKILITFFSPSGYEIRKNYPLADMVMYLPLDTKTNAKTFLSHLNPNLVIFIKYELWLNYLNEVAQKGIPHILVSARVRKESRFFTSLFSSLYRRAFQNFTHIFTQDELSEKLIKDFSGNQSISTVSDTRYDRVSSNRKTFTPIPEIEAFKGNSICLVCGSTWKVGEELIFDAFESLYEKYPIKLILAPHEINQDRIKKWESRFPDVSIRFSQIENLSSQHRILWIDNIGMLSRLYAYADLAYVGGGFGSGLHNILEAAVFGVPVIFGPRIKKFPEAEDLIKNGGGFSVNGQKEFTEKVKSLLDAPKLREEIFRKNTAFVDAHSGATQKIINWIDSAKILRK